MTSDYSALFRGDGDLAATIDGFQPREEQQRLTEAVGQALDQARILAAEAGTGVGKTFAYLAPVLQAGRKVLISTGTRTLQDQIFYRDLPVVRKALGQPVKVALLKGRSNYLCRHRLELALGERNLPHDEARDLMAVNSWAPTTQTGDRAELETVSEKARIWPRVTSTVDNCIGRDCPVYSKCWVVKARREAQEADVVVVNHHLLLADMALKEEGFGELLPQVDGVIVDEAHQFPDIAGQYFGEAVSARQLRELARDTLAEYLETAADMPELRPCLDQLDTAVRQLRLSLGQGDSRLDWQECQQGERFGERLTALIAALSTVDDYLDVLAERSRGLDGCRQRAERFLARLTAFKEHDDSSQIRWAETWKQNITLHLTPQDVGPRLSEFIHAEEKAWIFTSATLAVGHSLDHFCNRVGIDDAERLILGSPFDYEHNALLYTPAHLPDTGTKAYVEAVVDAALPVVEANHGGTFLLFTSYWALQHAAEYLAGLTERELLVQGDGPRPRLIERFRQAGDAVLLGTRSFWEGVDVKGAALSLVVIDKLPFAALGDPVLKARLNALEETGGNSFMDVQLPQAVIALKQGVGRLIRDAADTGVMMLCDPRIAKRSYGKIFINSLPPMRRTDNQDAVLAFMQNRNSSSQNVEYKTDYAS